MTSKSPAWQRFERRLSLTSNASESEDVDWEGVHSISASDWFVDVGEQFFFVSSALGWCNLRTWCFLCWWRMRLFSMVKSFLGAIEDKLPCVFDSTVHLLRPEVTLISSVILNFMTRSDRIGRLHTPSVRCFVSISDCVKRSKLSRRSLVFSPWFTISVTPI